jgi:hypothetical protein
MLIVDHPVDHKVGAACVVGWLVSAPPVMEMSTSTARFMVFTIARG